MLGKSWKQWYPVQQWQPEEEQSWFQVSWKRFRQLPPHWQLVFILGFLAACAASWAGFLIACKVESELTYKDLVARFQSENLDAIKAQIDTSTDAGKTALAWYLFRTGRYEQVGPAMADLSEALPYQARKNYILANCALVTGQTQQAQTLLEIARRLYAAAGIPDGLFRCDLLAIRIDIQKGHFHAAESKGLELLKTGREDVVQEADIYTYLTTVYTCLENYHQAEIFAQKAWVIYADKNLPFKKAVTLSSFALFAIIRGDLARGRECVVRANGIFYDLGRLIEVQKNEIIDSLIVLQEGEQSLAALHDNNLRAISDPIFQQIYEQTKKYVQQQRNVK